MMTNRLFTQPCYHEIVFDCNPQSDGYNEVLWKSLFSFIGNELGNYAAAIRKLDDPRPRYLISMARIAEYTMNGISYNDFMTGKGNPPRTFLVVVRQGVALIIDTSEEIPEVIAEWDVS